MQAPPTPHAHAHEHDHHDPLRWIWVLVGTALGIVFVGTFLFIVDPGLQRPVVAAYVVALSLILSGVVVGRLSPGETIRETALAGTVVILFVGAVATFVADLPVSFVVWLAAPLYTAPMTMLGGWVGEMLQGTMEEAMEDEALDWPWVIVSVVIGLLLATFSVMIASAQLGLEPDQTVWIFAGSFLVTGILVGLLSPGMTMIEPAIASGMMAVVNLGFVIAWFGEVDLGRIVVVGFGGGVLLALLGGFLGEKTQALLATAQMKLAEPARES